MFICTPHGTKKYAGDLPVVALVLLYELCQNAYNGTSTLEELLLDFFSNVTISRNISKFTIYLCNEYKLWRYFKANNECFWLRLDISQIFPCALEGNNCNGMLRRRHFLVTFIVSKIESFYSNKIQTKLHWTPLWKNDVASSTGPDSPVIVYLNQ